MVDSHLRRTTFHGVNSCLSVYRHSQRRLEKAMSQVCANEPYMYIWRVMQNCDMSIRYIFANIQFYPMRWYLAKNNYVSPVVEQTQTDISKLHSYVQSPLIDDCLLHEVCGSTDFAALKLWVVSQRLMLRWKYYFSYDHWSQASWAQPVFRWKKNFWWVLL